MYIRSSIHYIYACIHQCTSDHPYITYNACINVHPIIHILHICMHSSTYIRSSIHYIYACIHQCTSDHPYITYMHACINVHPIIHTLHISMHSSMYFRSSIHYIYACMHQCTIHICMHQCTSDHPYITYSMHASMYIRSSYITYTCINASDHPYIHMHPIIHILHICMHSSMYIRSSIHYIYACMHQCTSDHPYITCIRSSMIIYTYI